MILGICGGSGSGKTTLARRLREEVGEDNLAYLQQDSYYRDIDTLPAPLRASGNFDHPDCIDFPLLVAQLDALQRGAAVSIPHYDFATHHRTPETTHQAPKPVILIEGILIFSQAELRERMDLRLFVDTDDDIRLLRRIRRDVRERGRSLDSVLDQYATTVRPMHLQFVEPSKRFADLIIPENANNDLILDILVGKLRAVRPPAV